MKGGFVNSYLKVVTNVFNSIFKKTNTDDVNYQPSTNPNVRPPKHHTTRIGGWGNCHNQDACDWETLRILPKHLQTKDNCNFAGVSNINQFKVEATKG